MKELAIKLNIKTAQAIGHLHLLWHAALEQQEDGDLNGWSDEFIAESAGYISGVQGEFIGESIPSSSEVHDKAHRFINALQETGWLDGRVIHDWLDYSGRYLESKYRTSNPEKLRSICLKHPESVLSRSKVSPSLPSLPNLNLPLPPAGAFESIWPKYPRREGKKSAEKHFNTSVKTLQDWLDIQNALENYLRKIKTEGTLPTYILHGKTWFFNWRDYVNYNGIERTTTKALPTFKENIPPPEEIYDPSEKAVS